MIGRAGNPPRSDFLAIIEFHNDVGGVHRPLAVRDSILCIRMLCCIKTLDPPP